MKNVSIAIAIILTLACCSSPSTPNNKAVAYVEYDVSTQMSIDRLNDSIYSAYKRVKSEKAEHLYEVATEVGREFNWLTKYFQNWQRRLIEGAHRTDETPNLADKEIVTKLLVTEKGADTLAGHIFHFRDRMVRLLPKASLRERMPLKNLREYGNVSSGQEYKIFENMKAGEALSLFNTFINDAHASQAMILEGVLNDLKSEQ